MRRGRRGILIAAAGVVLLAAVGAAVVARHAGPPEHPLATAFADPAARRAIEAAATRHGWRVVQTGTDQIPFEQHAGDGYRGHGGEMIVLVGPTAVALEGYYCGNNWCDQPVQSHEAIELWVMPRFYPDGRDGFALQAMRAPAMILEDDRLRVYALISRWWPGGTFDLSITDASRETSPLGPPGQDLPVSWATWRDDLADALARRTS